MKRLWKYLRATYLGLILFFLYAPIAVMIVLSFNAGKTRSKWEGFSIAWYEELFDNSAIMGALKVTLIVAFVATAVSVVLGTLGAIGIHASKKGRAKLLMNLSYLPMTMPDIVTGVSLMMLFVFIKVPRGMLTMILAHITFDTPYVLFAVLPKLRQMDPNTYEAALDLGCTPLRALTKVIIPEIRPGIVTGGLLALTMSLDDFVISYFTSDKEQNLSTLIYSAAKRGVKPDIYALSTIMFVVMLTLLIIINKRSTLESMG